METCQEFYIFRHIFTVETYLKPISSVVNENGENSTWSDSETPVEERISAGILEIGGPPRVLFANKVNNITREGDVQNFHKHEISIPRVCENVEVPRQKNKEVQLLRFQRYTRSTSRRVETVQKKPKACDMHHISQELRIIN